MLKVVAGLLTASAGEVTVDGTSLLGVPAERRPVGMVRQQPLLFGHLCVGDDVAFGLRMRGVPRAARQRRVAEMLDLVCPIPPDAASGSSPAARSSASRWPGPRSSTRGRCSAGGPRPRRRRRVDATAGSRRPARRRPSTPTPRPWRPPGSSAGSTRCPERSADRRSRARSATLGAPADEGPGVLVVHPESLRVLGAASAPNTGTAGAAVSSIPPATATTVRWVPRNRASRTVAGTPVEPGDRIHLQLPPPTCRVLPVAAPLIDTSATSEYEDARA